MLEIFKAIIEGVWSLLSIQLTVDDFTFRIWHIFALFAILAIMINGLFGKKGGEI